MALKERKQITGTTSQINAYAGHEGQVVWDKDKKTLVGMSGTAGTNYPLATQEYADNKVSHLEGKVDTSNAAITEALNKKENAGTCLPLTGGKMSGGITFNNVAGVRQNTTAEYEELIVYAHDLPENWPGGVLSCRGHKGSVESERGSFALGARQRNGAAKYLAGLTDGRLLWDGSEIMRSGTRSATQLSLGATGAKYTAPFTGWLTIAGAVAEQKQAGHVELYNESANISVDTTALAYMGWMRTSLFVRKGDVVSIFYYNFDPNNRYVSWYEV